MGARSDFEGRCKQAELVLKIIAMGMFLLGLVACAGTGSLALKDDPLKAVSVQGSAGQATLRPAVDRRQGEGTIADRELPLLSQAPAAACAAQPRPAIMGSVERKRPAGSPEVPQTKGVDPDKTISTDGEAQRVSVAETPGGGLSRPLSELPPASPPMIHPEPKVDEEALAEKLAEIPPAPPGSFTVQYADDEPPSRLLTNNPDIDQGRAEGAPGPGTPAVAFADADANSTGQPPDTDMDVSDSYVVTDYNSILKVYDKAGNLLAGPVDIQSIFSSTGTMSNCGATETTASWLSDPQVRYDEESQRWFLAMLRVTGSGAGSYLCLACSQSSDPRGSWRGWESNMGATTVADYPHMGVGQDAVFIGSNDFVSGSYSASMVTAVTPKANMLSGGTLTWTRASLASQNGYAPQPVKRHGYNVPGQWPPSGTPHYILAVEGATTGAGQVWRWTFPTASGSLQYVSSPGFSYTTDATYPGSSTYVTSSAQKIDPLDFRWMDAEMRWPYIWSARTLGNSSDSTCHGGAYNTLPGSGKVCDLLQWGQLDVSSGTPSIVQQGNYAVTGNHLFCPDVAVDKSNNFAVGYTYVKDAGASGPTFVSAYLSGRESTDTLGTLAGPLSSADGDTKLTTYNQGTAPSDRMRWGDYLSMAIDPNGCDLWFNGMRAKSGLGATYNDQTYVQKFSFASCTPGATRLATLDKAVYQCHQTVSATITDTGGAPSNAVYHSTSGGPYPATISGGPGSYAVSAVTTDQLGAMDGDDIWLTFTGSDAAAYSSTHSGLSCSVNVCVSSVDALTGGCDNDAYMDQGETLNVFVHMKNSAAYALPTGFYADLVVDPGYPDSNVTIVNGTAEWAALQSGGEAIPAGKTFQVRYTGAYASFCKVTEHFQVVNIRATDGSWVGGAGCSAGSDKFTELANANPGTPAVSESFNGTTFPPTGWTLTPNVSGTATWARATSGSNPTATPHSGAGMAFFDSFTYTAGAQARLVAPAFSLVGATSSTVTFWMYHSGTYTNADTIAVQVSTTSATSGFKTVATFTRNVPSTLAWLQHSVDLSAYAGQSTVYVGFLATSQYGLNMYMDDITITNGATVCQASACTPAPVLVNNDGDWAFDDSQCNNNGYPDAKESGLLTLYLANTGNDTAYGVQATLSCPSCPSGVTICKNTATYGDIPYGTGYVYGPGGNGFEIELPAGITPDADLPFVITCTTTNSPAYNPVINVIPSPHSLLSLRAGTPTLSPGAGSTTHTWQDGFTTAPGTTGTGGRIPTSGGSPTWASTAWTTVGDVSSSTTQSADGDSYSARLRLTNSVTTSSMVRTFSTSGYDNDLLFYFLLYIPVTNTTFTMAYSPDNGTNWYTIISIPAGAVTTAGWYYFGPYSLYWTLYDGTGTGFGPTAANAILNNSNFKLRFQAVKGAGAATNWYVDGFWIANYKYVNTATTCGAVCNPPDAPGITRILDNYPCAQDGIKVFYDSALAATSHDLYKDGGLAVTGYVSGALYNPGDSSSHSYVVRAINAYGGTNSTAVAFADATAPVAGISGDSANVCPAATVTLSTDAGYANYQWYVGGSPIGGATTSSYEVSASGSYTVSHTLGGCTATSPAKAVTITCCTAITPGSPADPSAICSGNTATLTVSASGAGLSYQWYQGTAPSTASPVGTDSSSFTTPALTSTTNYWVRVSSACGFVDSRTATVAVNAVPAAPVASNSGPICAGSALYLYASTVSGAIYSWTGPNGFISPLQNPVILNAPTSATGIYSVTATVSGCTSPPSTTTAAVNAATASPAFVSALPIPDVVTAQAQQILTVTNASGSSMPTSFAFTWDGNFIFSAPSHTVPLGFWQEMRPYGAPYIPTATYSILWSVASGTFFVDVNGNGAYDPGTDYDVSLSGHTVAVFRTLSPGTPEPSSVGYRLVLQSALIQNPDAGADYPVTALLTFDCGNWSASYGESIQPSAAGCPPGEALNDVGNAVRITKSGGTFTVSWDGAPTPTCALAYSLFSSTDCKTWQNYGPLATVGKTDTTVTAGLGLGVTYILVAEMGPDGMMGPLGAYGQ
jgi:hypothetical protein